MATEVVLARYTKMYQNTDHCPNLVVGKGNSKEECNKIAQDFAENNPGLIRISWEYREK